MNKKAQEEMIGFMMIILLVSVIFLVFLGIFMWQKPKQQGTDSAEVSQFLDAMLEYTTTCARYSSNYLSIDELIAYCDEGRICPAGDDAGEDTCVILEEITKNLIESSWNFGPNSEQKGYEFEIKRDPGTPPLFSALTLNTCTSHHGADKPISTPTGKVIIELRICPTIA